MLTYAIPYFAVQAWIELARAHLALADLAGTRTLRTQAKSIYRKLGTASRSRAVAWAREFGLLEG